MVFLAGHRLLVSENWEDRRLSEFYLELSVLLRPSHSGQLHRRMLFSPPRRPLLVFSRKPEAYKALVVFVSRLL